MYRKFIICLSLILIFGLTKAGAAELAGVEIHGFVSQGFLWSDDNNYYSAETEDGSFQFNELGINFGKNLADHLRIGMQFFSRDLGRTGNNKVEIDWAYGDYRWKDWMGIRFGLMKMPHGLYNENRDQDMLRTPVLLPQSVYPEMERDYYTRMWGGEIYGNTLTAIGDISYRFLVGTYTPDEDNSGLAVAVAGGGFMEIREFNHGIQYSAGITWETPLEGLRFGASGWLMNDAGADLNITADFGPDLSAGSVTSLEVERWATVYSVEYIWENLRLAAEYRLEHTKNRWQDIAFFNSETDAEGYYLGLSYRFTDWLEAGTYYSFFYPDKDDRGGDSYVIWGQDDFLAWQKDFALSLRFDINEYFLLKIEGHVMDGAVNMLAADNPDGMEQRAFLFAAKATFNF